MSRLATPAERTIVRCVEEAIGAHPVLLCGSRATGEAGPSSDYDVVVVLPLLRIPFLVRRLAVAEGRASEQLTSDVAINPLPARRLRQLGQRNLYAWKLRREAVVLSAPDRFHLAEPPPAPATRAALSSYATSGLRFLIDALEPGYTGSDQPSAELRAAIRKSVRHAAQLRLLATDAYAPTLSEALTKLGLAGQDLTKLAEPSQAGDWAAARDALLPWVDLDPEPPLQALVANLQYLLLSFLRWRRLPVRDLLNRDAVRTRLTRSCVRLARAVREDGTLDGELTWAARAALPPSVRSRTDATWSSVRDAVGQAWPQADPLGGA